MQPRFQSPSNHRPIHAPESGLRSCQPFHGRSEVREGRPKAFAFPEYEHVGFAELIDEAVDFTPVPSGILREIERQGSAELGPRRFARVKELLFRAWESERMI
jgi:hypothetical protein